MVALSIEQIRGTDDTTGAQRLLRAGPLTVVLENGTLRWIRLGPHEIVRGIYAAVRDRNWGTILPRFVSYDVHAHEDAFEVTFDAEHVQDEIDFAWHGTIRGTSDGSISFVFDGRARRAFYRNRLGFCVLHPMELAGSPVTIAMPSGTMSSAFPEHISPHQPFKEIVSMHHDVPSLPGASVDVQFEGDLFETEDQRNWTDASYKTYCTPLALPYPVLVHEGERVRQTITLRVNGLNSASADAISSASPHVHVSSHVLHKLPEIGLELLAEHNPPSPRTVERLRALHLAYLWVELDLQGAQWKGHLQQATELAQTLRIELELSLVCGDAGEGLEALVQELYAMHAPVARVFVFPRSSHATTEQLIRRTRELFHQAGLSVVIAGGSRANFAEFNRATLPLASMDAAGYPINPQVHAFDNASIMETIAAQAVTVRDALRITHDLPLSIGPLTLKPRFNAVATGPAKALAPGELPDNVDSRQPSLFAASWTVGSVRALDAAGARWLTYFATSGWRGVMEEEQPAHAGTPFPTLPGATFPIYHVLADLGEFAGSDILALETSTPAVEALALRKDNQVMLLIANTTDQRQAVSVEMPDLLNVSLRMLDETTAQQALFEGERYREQGAQQLPGPLRSIHFELLPYAIARLVGQRGEG